MGCPSYFAVCAQTTCAQASNDVAKYKAKLRQPFPIITKGDTLGCYRCGAGLQSCGRRPRRPVRATILLIPLREERVLEDPRRPGGHAPRLPQPCGGPPRFAFSFTASKLRERPQNVAARTICPPLPRAEPARCEK